MQVHTGWRGLFRPWARRVVYEQRNREDDDNTPGLPRFVQQHAVGGVCATLLLARSRGERGWGTAHQECPSATEECRGSQPLLQRHYPSRGAIRLRASRARRLPLVGPSQWVRDGRLQTEGRHIQQRPVADPQGGRRGQ